MDFTGETISKITGYVEAMNRRDQKKLLDALEKKALMDKARHLNKSVKKNQITMKEICDIVSEVRSKRKHA